MEGCARCDCLWKATVHAFDMQSGVSGVLAQNSLACHVVCIAAMTQSCLRKFLTVYFSLVLQ
eukprot:3796978-Amphidinium_carterae.1